MTRKAALVLPTLYTTLQVPRCWRRLVDTVFPEDLKGIKDGDRHDVAVDDPEPYYDDDRIVSAQFANGKHIGLSLSSGQGNYFCHFDIGGQEIGGKEPWYESEPFHELHEQDTLEAEFQGLRYVARIEYYGRK